jgi:hypothetical protein
MASDRPAFKDAYSFDPVTRELLGVVRVFLCKEDDTYYLPDNVTELAPPTDLQPRQVARLDAKGKAWVVVADYRNRMLWDTTTGAPVANTLQLGDAPPRGCTAEPPPITSDAMPVRNTWDSRAKAWRQEPDYSRFMVWWKASGERAPAVPSGLELPDTLTLLSPPQPETNLARRWDDTNGAWRLLPDFRGLIYWTADGQEHRIDQVGDVPPDGYLTAPPTPSEPPQASDSTTIEG